MLYILYTYTFEEYLLCRRVSKTKVFYVIKLFCFLGKQSPIQYFKLHVFHVKKTILRKEFPDPVRDQVKKEKCKLSKSNW